MVEINERSARRKLDKDNFEACSSINSNLVINPKQTVRLGKTFIMPSDQALLFRTSTAH